MLKTLGKLDINKSSDYYGEVVKALENSGFVVVWEQETSSENHYIIAKECKNER